MKYFRMIVLKTSNEQLKQKLMDTLLIHQLTCFGVGQHLLVLDEKPEGAQALQNPIRVLQLTPVKKVMQACQANLITFDHRGLMDLKKYLSADYVLKKQTPTSLRYHSKTQAASFTLFQNGQLKTTKNLLDIALMSNLVRILNGKKPVRPNV